MPVGRRASGAGGRGCSSRACSRVRPRTCGAGWVSGQAPTLPAPSRPQGRGRGAEVGLGAPTFLPNHTLQDLPLVLVQAHSKGAAVRADDLHLVHFDLRRGNLERGPGSPGALPTSPLLWSCQPSATSSLGTTHLGPRGGGTQGMGPRPPSGPDSLPASVLS